MLIAENTALLVIDVQEKLFPVMFEKEALLSNLQKIIRGAGILDIPIIITEQNPAGMGGTLRELLDLTQNAGRVTKFNFSCCDEAGFKEKLNVLGRRQILICGIESHICVYQTSIDLQSNGYEVHLLGDCVSSRTAQNKELAVRRMVSEKIKLTGVEMALFELLRSSNSSQFKAISSLVKG
jgi:nicotinamidase-related amidase